VNAYARTAETYLTQRILNASPEQQAALIMEAGQLHLGRAIQSLKKGDPVTAASSFLRVTEVLREATIRLNLEEGNELALSLNKLYDFWAQELLAGSASQNIPRLEAVAQGMGEVRQAWEQFHEKKNAPAQPSSFNLGNQVV